jgi:hypothetical protein
VQQNGRYPIEYIVDFLETSFPKRLASGENWEYGFGQSIAFLSPRVDPSEVQKMVRSYVDEWINSGFQPDGSERPYRRNFAPKWNFEDGKTNLLPAPRAVCAMARFCGGSLSVPGGRGGSYIVVDSQRASSVAIGPQGGVQSSFESSSDDDSELLAASLFLHFYDSEWIFRLMRCAHCEVLAVPIKTPKQTYLRGWHCRSCMRKAPAMISTARARQQERDTWLELVRLAVIAYESKRPAGDRARWILSKVQGKMPAKMPAIKRNRVTRLCNFFDANKASGMNSEQAIDAAVVAYKQAKERKRS